MNRKRRKNDDILDIVEHRHDDDVIDFTGKCVCDVVQAIADAQDAIKPAKCRTSCEKSIQNLLAPVQRRDFDTVPFILYCKDTCKPFKATGVKTKMDGNDLEFKCIESFVFRVKEVDNDCCAVLELLKTGENITDEDPMEIEPCDQLDGEDVKCLKRTGICITVDLNCFCAITCLPAADLF